MKKIQLFAFFFSFLFSIGIYAQHDVYNHSDWTKKRRIIFKYDKAGNINEKEFQNWNGKDQDWENDKFQFKLFNQQSKIIEDVYKVYDSESKTYKKWRHSVIQISEKEDFSIEKIIERWNRKKNIFIPSIKQVTIFSDKEKTKEIDRVRMIWNKRTQEWRNHSKTITHYTPNEQPEMIMNQKWDKNENRWINQAVQEIYYSDDNLEKTTVSKNWDAEQKKWLNINKKKVLWNKKKTAVKEQIFSEWSDDVNDWIVTKRNIIKQFEKNAEYAISTVLNKETNTWENSTRSYYYYNTLGSIVDIVYQKWDKEIGDWINVSRTQYERNHKNIVQKEIYKTAVPFNGEQNESEISELNCIFPNPYSFGANINCDILENGGLYTVQLFNQNGKTVFEKNNMNGSFSISNSLPGGLYILAIREGERIVHRSKFIIPER